jgi:hypothetical protein
VPSLPNAGCALDAEPWFPVLLADEVELGATGEVIGCDVGAGL